MDDPQIHEMFERLHAENKETTKLLGELVGWKDSVNVNVSRFWEQDWPHVRETIQDHDIRLRALETAIISLQQIPILVEAIQNEVRRTQGDVRQLERWRVKVVSYVAAAGAFGAVIGTGLLAVLNGIFQII